LITCNWFLLIAANIVAFARAIFLKYKRINARACIILTCNDKEMDGKGCSCIWQSLQLFLMGMVKMVNKQCLHFLTTVWYNFIIATLIFSTREGLQFIATLLSY